MENGACGLVQVDSISVPPFLETSCSRVADACTEWPRKRPINHLGGNLGGSPALNPMQTGARKPRT